MKVFGFRMMKREFAYGLLLTAFALGSFALANRSFAATAVTCLPGIPCIVEKTYNDPDPPPLEDPNDGPNAEGKPNRPKLNASECMFGKSVNCACDADFMNQIYARSYLEAQRETIMNEVVIRKPDSVMEYTCFDQMAKMTAERVGTIFSETTRWQSVTVPLTPSIGPNSDPGSPYIGTTSVSDVDISIYMGAGRLKTSIENLVLKALDDVWIKENFGHTFLGGSVDYDYEPGGSTYICSYMTNVHWISKCNNFNMDDPFLDFRTLVNLDPRILPDLCDNTNITDELIDLSENKEFKYVNFTEDYPTYQNLRLPTPCLSPIPTGVTVTYEEKEVDSYGNAQTISSEEFPDKFCVNPSCYYDKDEDKCKPN